LLKGETVTDLSIDELPEEDSLDDVEYNEDLASNPAPEQKAQVTREPLFSLLFKDAVDPEDDVLRDYAEYVVPHLSALLADKSAKGGNFVRDKLNDGATAEQVQHYGDDQTMRAHILNGLLPTAQIARTLRTWGQARFEDDFDEVCYRLLCAGFTLHDWLKLPEVDQQLQAHGLQHNTVNPAVHVDLVSSLLRTWGQKLGFEEFLAPIGGLDRYLNDLIYIASNTQLQWGVMHNLGALPNFQADGRRIRLATELATLADYLAYLGRTPVDAVEHPAIQRLFAKFTTADIGAYLSYHHLADLRGVLSNMIHNATIEALHVPGYREPLLYAPTGVVYLCRQGAPNLPAAEQVAESVIQRIQEQCGELLARDLIGFNRDGKGLKYADYYEVFFSPQQLVQLIPSFGEKRMMGKSDAQKRYDNMLAKGMVDSTVDLDLPAYPEVDRLAESCALAASIAKDTLPTFNSKTIMIEAMGLQDLSETFNQIDTFRGSGGVPYSWYYLAGNYRKLHPGLDPNEWSQRIRDLLQLIAEKLPNQGPQADNWGDIKQYIVDHLRIRGQNISDIRERLQNELARYSTARKSGRGASTICSLCSLPYNITPQQEAAILFAPMVYTNKQPLHGSKAIRHICGICGMEMMLRQLFMKSGRESGGNFEKRRFRYLYFYPTYFFTPETLRMMRAVQDNLKRISFTELRTFTQPNKENQQQSYNFDPAYFQHLGELMLNPALFERTHNDDRLFRLRFAKQDPVTFSFIGLPPQDRDAKDAESWIQPAYLALIVPLLLDVKVVASESMMPIIQEATELSETVAFDGAHAFVGYLTELTRRQQDRKSVGRFTPGRFNIDELVPALHALLAGYMIHLDANAKTSGGFDYRWHDIAPLARNLASSPLYAFHYLKKALRREGSDVPSAYKADIYLDFVNSYLQGEKDMSHAQELVRLYRKFYRHGSGRLNSNAILRPIREAADTLLDADLRLFNDDTALVELIAGRLRKSISSVSQAGSSGTVPVWLYDKAQGNVNEQIDHAIYEFAEYFVNQIYRDVFNRNRAALAGKQLNLLKNACETIYISEQRREWNERGEAPQEDQAPTDGNE
jgi:CRISPR-associated protein Csc3